MPDPGNKPVELDSKKIELIDKLADFITKRGLGVVAIMFLESTKPLHYLGSQAAIFFEPFLNILFTGGKFELFREAMEDRRYIDYLMNKIEKSE